MEKVKDKVYIDGSDIAGVMLARLKRVGHETPFFKDMLPMRDSSVMLGS